MMDRDPLEQWLWRPDRTAEPQWLARVRQDLLKLEQWLDQPADGRRKDLPNVHGALWGGAAQIEPADCARVQQLYRRVVQTKGTGKSYVEEELLSLLAWTYEPANIPFFLELLDLTPPRDRMIPRRRELALAALALLVYRRDDADALAALLGTSAHPQPLVRALAVYYLRCIYTGIDGIDPDNLPPLEEPDPTASDPLAWLHPSEVLLDSPLGPDDLEEAGNQPPELEPLELRRPMPPEVLERLHTIATADPATEPRFLARALLSDIGMPLPLDNPQGVYTFKVKLRGLAGMHRVIVLRSTDTLHDLHLAIQHAIRWDADHLYSFYLNNKRYDERYQYSSPWERDSPRWADQVELGALGLALKHVFMYYFDYGDSHEFDVEVVGIAPQAEPGDYPRVIERKGPNPQQYWYGEDEEDLEEGDEDLDEEDL